MGNAGSGLPEKVGNAAQKAKDKIHRTVHGKRSPHKGNSALRGSCGAYPFATTIPDLEVELEGGRRLAVFCDACGVMISPGDKYLPVRSGSVPEDDRDICSTCADSYSHSESAFFSPLLQGLSMEVMYRTPDTEALLNAPSLRDALVRCFAAYHDRPLLGVLQRRRGRTRGVSSSPFASEAGATQKTKSKVEFATYAQLQRRSTYISSSLSRELLLAAGSKAGVLCEEWQKSRDTLAWVLACTVFGRFPLVLSDVSPGEEDDRAGLVLGRASRLIEEGVHVVLASKEQVPAVVMAVVQSAVQPTDTFGRTREHRDKLMRDIVVVGDPHALSEAIAPLVDPSLSAASTGGLILELSGVDLDVRRCSDGLALLTIKWLVDGKEHTRQISLHSLVHLEEHGRNHVGDAWFTWQDHGQGGGSTDVRQSQGWQAHACATYFDHDKQPLFILLVCHDDPSAHADGECCSSADGGSELGASRMGANGEVLPAPEVEWRREEWFETGLHAFVTALSGPVSPVSQPQVTVLAEKLGRPLSLLSLFYALTLGARAVVIQGASEDHLSCSELMWALPLVAPTSIAASASFWRCLHRCFLQNLLQADKADQVAVRALGLQRLRRALVLTRQYVCGQGALEEIEWLGSFTKVVDVDSLLLQGTVQA